jgi:hypothetical protein
MKAVPSTSRQAAMQHCIEVLRWYAKKDNHLGREGENPPMWNDDGRRAHATLRQPDGAGAARTGKGQGS